ncbi:MAG TPA: class I SAM-dependent methyltransferase [Caulobacteraceae bacterium]
MLYRFVTDENYRNSALVRLAPPRNLFQPDNYTEPDRYPDLFRLAAREIGDGPEKQILSFGCSTGEEVFALRGCFPTAHIHGIDINRRNIAVCNRKLAEDPDPAIDFRTAGSAAGEDPDSYDAIFCMAIFRHGALGDRVRDRCDDLIRFQDFDNAIADLTRALKRGGLLFIENSHFRFSDTSAFPDFEVVGEARREQRETDGPIYDRDNRLIAGVNDRDIAFRKAKRRAR